MLHKNNPQVPPLGVPVRPPVSVPMGVRPPVVPRPDIPMDPMRMDPRMAEAPAFTPDRPAPFMEDPRRDPRNRDPRERTNGFPNMRNPPPVVPGPNLGSNVPRGPPPQLPPHLAGADPEKAQLIMQVLQLTDEQIAMLPLQQRESIMVLKEQINQGSRWTKSSSCKYVSPNLLLWFKVSCICKPSLLFLSVFCKPMRFC